MFDYKGCLGSRILIIWSDRTGFRMVFSNLFFLYIFMPLLFVAYFVINNSTYRRTVLVLFSLFFYAWGEPLCVFIMIGLVLADYIFGILINKAFSATAKKTWLVVAIAFNLGLLCLYKYLGFFTETINTVFNVTVPVISITMPIGISFFTFQSMSYVIDVYRDDTEVQRSYFKLLLYVSFFPQLIAGPIVRYKDIADQIDNRQVNVGDICDGLYRFSVGLAKKVIIADCCANVIASLYGLSDVTLLARWGGAVFFTLQLYFDFSGYSDMAIGLGKMFGFNFMENFNYPLVSSSATDFWRRWHISLGTFFRDYVYIPLGGNRHNQWRNIFITWFLTGMWHGASWNFILWGVYYAIILTFEKSKLLNLFKSMWKPISFVLSRVYTTFITVFGFAIFYFTDDLFKNLGYLFGIGCKSGTDILTNSILMDNIILLGAGVLFAVPIVRTICAWLEKHANIHYSVQRIAKTVITVIFIAVSTVRLVGNTYSPFLYYRF